MFWSDNQNHLSWRPVESTASLCFAILSPLGFQGRSPWLYLARARGIPEEAAAAYWSSYELASSPKRLGNRADF
jgi:hypothetical protein